MTRRITQEDIDIMTQIVHNDLNLAPEFWSKQDIDDMRACGMKVPRSAGSQRHKYEKGRAKNEKD